MCRLTAENLFSTSAREERRSTIVPTAKWRSRYSDFTFPALSVAGPTIRFSASPRAASWIGGNRTANWDAIVQIVFITSSLPADELI